MKYEIYTEGYRATGDSGPAYKLGEVEADSFREACIKLCAPKEFQERHGNFDPVSLTVWGCRLFDNLNDASASYG